MTDLYTAAVDQLSRVAGVRGAMIVDQHAGVPVVEELAEGVAGQAVAALAASLFARAGRATSMSAFGRVDTIQLEADGGHVVVAGAGELLVVVVAESTAQLGLIRLQAHRAAEGLR